MSEWLKAYRENHADFDHPSSIDALGSDPFIAFSKWFDQAATAQEKEANAFVLSTASPDLRISSRILYLKELHGNEKLIDMIGKQNDINYNVNFKNGKITKKRI